MSEQDFSFTQQRVVELVIRLGVLLVLVLWCFTILEPFVLIIAWGAIVAVALHPVFNKVAAALGGREKFTAILLAGSLVAMLVVPSYMLTDSLVASARFLSEASESGEIFIPAPPEGVADLPLIGEDAYALWKEAADNLPKFLEDFTPQFKAVGAWLLSTITGTGLTILQFIISFVIAGVFLATAEKGAGATESLAIRLAGNKGPEFATLASGTIRNVALGIVGVSLLQTALLALGYLVIGLPGAGFWALITLILCIVQIGPTIVAVGAIIYVFSTADTLPASIFAVWTFVMMICDSFLKPIVFGRGASVPTLVIFLGAIGGMLAYGIIGLFVGAVVLSVGYKLYEAWLEQTPPVVADDA